MFSFAEAYKQLNGILYKQLNGILYTDVWVQRNTWKQSTAVATSWKWNCQAAVLRHERSLRTEWRPLNATWWLCFQMPLASRASLSALSTRFPTATSLSCQLPLLHLKAVSKVTVHSFEVLMVMSFTECWNSWVFFWGGGGGGDWFWGKKLFFMMPVLLM